jgi:ABC-type antimicrobial peptide transport system permease subunit
MTMIFTVVGISVLLLKKIQEERNEISIQRIIGFRKSKVFSRLFMENFMTVLFGITAGAVSSVIALLPIFKENTSLLIEYPVSAFIVISVCSIVFLSIFITSGLKAFNKMMPESR